MSWKRWNWLDDGFLPLVLAVLRVCWLWPWIALLQRWMASSRDGILIPLWMALGLLLGGAAVARGALALSALRARLIVAVVGLAAVGGGLWWQLYRLTYPVWDLRWLGAWATDATRWIEWETRGIPLAFFGFLAMSYLWLRGVLDGGTWPVMREQIWRTFTIGFVALTGLLLMARAVALSLPTGTESLVWLYFATGMAALAVTGLRMAGALAPEEGTESQVVGGRPRFDRYWFGSVISVTAGLLGLALAFSALVAPEVVTHALGAVWVVVRQGIIYVWFIVALVLYPVAYLFAQLLAPLFDVLSGLTSLNLRPDFLDPEALGTDALPEGGSTDLASFPDELRWVALAVLIFLVGLVFALALRRIVSESQKQNGILETRDTVLSRDLLKEQMVELWRSWLDRLRGRDRAGISPFLPLDGETGTRKRVRSVYQSVLGKAQELGRPRLPRETPVEYNQALWEVGMRNREALSRIAAAYVQARYAMHPPTPQQAESMTQEWQKLQAKIDQVEEQEAGRGES